jgi:hypothetical protein
MNRGASVKPNPFTAATRNSSPLVAFSRPLMSWTYVLPVRRGEGPTTRDPEVLDDAALDGAALISRADGAGVAGGFSTAAVSISANTSCALGAFRSSDQLADGFLADTQPVCDRPAAPPLALEHLDAAQALHRDTAATAPPTFLPTKCHHPALRIAPLVASHGGQTRAPRPSARNRTAPRNTAALASATASSAR